MPAASRQATTELRRQTILEAALACFLERGVAATTIEDIRTRSGASIGSIYHHFGSKEQLARRLYAERVQDYQTGFLRELTRGHDARSGIEAVVRYHLWWISEHRDWALYLFHLREVEAISTGDRTLRECRRAYYRAIDEWLAPHVEQRVVRRLPSDLLRSLWFGPAHEFERVWLAGRATSPIGQAQDRLATAAWEAIKADHPP